MKLSSKISLSMGILTVLVGIVATFLMWQMTRVNEATILLADNRVPLVSFIGIVNNGASEYRISEIEYVRNNTSEARLRYQDRMDQYAKIIEENIKKVEPLLLSDKARSTLRQYLDARTEYRNISADVIRLTRENNIDEANELLSGLSRDTYQRMSEALTDLTAQAQINTNLVRDNAEDSYTTSRLIGIIMTVVAMLIAITLSLLLVRNTMRQLGKDPGELDSIALDVVAGNYNVDDGREKTGVYASIVQMVNALKENIEHARRESENASEQSRKALQAMEQAEAAGKEAKAKAAAMLVAADKLEAVGTVVSSASTELSAQIEQSDRGAAA